MNSSLCYRLLNRSSLIRKSLLVQPRRCGHIEEIEDQKSTLTLLNREKERLLVNSFSSSGFELNNSVFVVGPVAIFSNSVLAWRVSAVSQITTASLSLFGILEPKLDCLIIGTGDRCIRPEREVIKFLQSRRLNHEILTTEHAVSTFNYLNHECRNVAAVLLPPTKLKPMHAEQIVGQRASRKALIESTSSTAVDRKS